MQREPGQTHVEVNVLVAPYVWRLLAQTKKLHARSMVCRDQQHRHHALECIGLLVCTWHATGAGATVGERAQLSRRYVLVCARRMRPRAAAMYATPERGMQDHMLGVPSVVSAVLAGLPNQQAPLTVHAAVQRRPSHSPNPAARCRCPLPLLSAAALCRCSLPLPSLPAAALRVSPVEGHAHDRGLPPVDLAAHIHAQLVHPEQLCVAHLQRTQHVGHGVKEGAGCGGRCGVCVWVGASSSQASPPAPSRTRTSTLQHRHAQCAEEHRGTSLPSALPPRHPSPPVPPLPPAPTIN